MQDAGAGFKKMKDAGLLQREFNESCLLNPESCILPP